MKKLNREQVLHVADLARLKLTEEEIVCFEEQLGEIYEVIEKINEVNIDGDIMISPTENINMLREDEGEEGLSKEDIMKNVSSSKAGYISVPRVVEE